jgi:hypothetical protein
MAKFEVSIPVKFWVTVLGECDEKTEDGVRAHIDRFAEEFLDIEDYGSSVGVEVGRSASSVHLDAVSCDCVAWDELEVFGISGVEKEKK